jgi:hypothetical protein
VQQKEEIPMHHPFGRYLFVLTVAGAVLLALSPVPGRATSDTTYNVSGSYATTVACTGEPCVLVRTYSYDGTATCQTACTGAPNNGAFSLRLTGQGSFPPSPCVSKTVSGNLAVAYPPSPVFPAGAETTATITGNHNIDFHGYSIAGTVDATSTAFPSVPIKGFVSHPPSPCNPGAFSGVLTFHPPSPI